jgi:hypothetical protein
MLRTTIYFTVILLAGSAPGWAAGSKGALSAAEQTAAIQAVRPYALNYTERLPNYLCTLTTRHTSRPGNAINNPTIRTTTIEEQISFADKKEVRKIVRTEGSDRDSIVEPLSSGEFGNLLALIFDPASGADLKWDRQATLDGHKTDVLAFHVPQSSGYVLVQSTGSIRVPFEGFVYADAQTRAVLRIQTKCTDIPPHSEYRTVDMTLDYKATQVAGREFILPAHFVLNYFNEVADRQNINDGRYSAYRQFGADVSIQFEDQKNSGTNEVR